MADEDKPKRTRRIMRELALGEISGVDVPAQQGALVTIMKRGVASEINAALVPRIVKYWGGPTAVVGEGPQAREFGDVLGEYFENEARSEIMEAAWPVIGALDTALRSIIGDPNLDPSRKMPLLEKATNDFLLAIREEIEGGAADDLIEKIAAMLDDIDQVEQLETRLAVMKLDARVRKLKAALARI